jgi:hypothetical protein
MPHYSTTGACCICGASITIWDGVPRDRCCHCAAALREARRRAALLTPDDKRVIAKRAVDMLMRYGRVRLRLFPGLAQSALSEWPCNGGSK